MVFWLLVVGLVTEGTLEEGGSARVKPVAIVGNQIAIGAGGAGWTRLTSSILDVEAILGSLIRFVELLQKVCGPRSRENR